jgi:cysteine sulfinate desulfinase/cysteine desulfurase-like protein
MIELEAEEEVLYELLRSRQDSQGIVRYAPAELETELDMVSSKLEELLEKLYRRGSLVYVTRVNKETGRILKIVQL